MKLHATDHTVQRSGELIETQFTVRTTAKTFAILSSGLYSDKIAAPIRELCCNAYDAHVAAGTQDTPFEVTLPNSLNPTFSVRDYGTGLSDEGVRTLYTTYFDSTKTDSDAMIGALGLGSKSPFAYTNTFSIESRRNGLKAMYAAFINESGVPALAALMEPTPTDEPNGMTISFPVKSADLSKFVDRAKRVLMYFPVKPVVTGHYGFEPFSLSHSIEGTGWKIRTAEYSAYMSGAYVIQGCVAYPLDVSQLHGLAEAAIAVAGTQLDLFVPIGQVEVAPSREALSYDPITCDNLVRILEAAANEMRDQLQKQLDECATMWDARRMVVRWTNDEKMAKVFVPLNESMPFRFKNLPINLALDVDLSGITTAYIEIIAQNSRWRRHGNRNMVQESKQYTSADQPFTVYQGHTTVTMLDDLGKGFTGAIREYGRQRYSKTNKYQHYIVIRPVDHKVGISDNDMADILAQLGQPNVVNVTSLGLPQVAAKKSTYKARPKGTRLRFTGFTRDDRGRERRKFSRLTWQQMPVDFEEGGFYIPIERFEIVEAGINVYNIGEILVAATQSDLLSHDERSRTFGFTEKEMKEIDGDPKWVNLFTALRERSAAYLEDEARLTAATQHHFIASNSEVEQFLNGWNGMSNMFHDGDFKSFWDDLSVEIPFDLQRFDRAVELQRLLTPCGLAMSSVLHNRAGQWRNRQASLYNAYGMLQLIKLSYVDSNTRRILVDYINTCEDAFLYAEEHKAA